MVKRSDRPARVINACSFSKIWLRIFQDCQTAKLALHKLQTRYASKSPTTELSVLSNLLNIKISKSAYIVDNLSTTEADLKDGTEKCSFSESMKIALRLPSSSITPK